MAGENAAIVRAAFEAFERGDVDGVLARCDENIVIRQAPELFDVPSTQHGHAGVLEAFAIWPEQWDDFHVDVVRIAEHGEQVLVTTVNRGRSKDTGIEVKTPFSFVFRLHGGKVTEWDIYLREEDALEKLESVSPRAPRGSP
jgi:ketosteroid isomerase-like protein